MKRTVFTAALEVAISQANMEQIQAEMDALAAELAGARDTLQQAREYFSSALARMVYADEVAAANALVDEWLAGGEGPHSKWPRVNTNTQEKL